MNHVEFAKPIKATATKPAAKVGPDGKPLPPARTDVSDAKIASLLAKFGKQWLLKLFKRPQRHRHKVL